MFRSILDFFKSWSMEQSESKVLRMRILKFMMLTGTMACVIAAGLNVMNSRPLSNILLPSGLAALIMVLFGLARKVKWHYPVKLAFVLLISLIYVPVAWLASPGSSSAMPMYTVLILVVCILLIEKTVEFLIPILLVVELCILLRIEAVHPEWFLPYTDRFYHSFDLSVHFTVISITLVILLTIVNYSFSKEHQVLYEMSVTDQLTGTYNRRYLYQRLEEIHNYSRRNNQPYSVIMMDINHFKQVNDHYGHLAGDDVLRRLGDCLKTVGRSFDVVVRYGGDEFLIILPNTAGEDAAAVIVRIEKGFQEIASAYPAVPLSLAIGTADNLDQDFETILHQVDDRLYRRKYEMKA